MNLSATISVNSECGMYMLYAYAYACVVCVCVSECSDLLIIP